MVLSYMQKLDLGYSNHENFKTYYVTIIVKAVLLVLIFLFSSLIISSITSFMKQNKESFNYMMVYANVDSKLRSLIQLINNESYSILMLGIYNYYLALVPPNSPLLIPIRFLVIDIATKLRSGLNKKDLVPFIQNRVNSGISSFIKSYQTSNLLISENILDKDTLARMLRISSTTVGPLGLDLNLTFIKPVQYDNFINRYLVASMAISPFLQDLRKYTDGQEPPFAINDPPLLVDFVNLVVLMINQVASGSAGILPRNLDSIRAAATLMTQTSIEGLQRYTLYMSFGFFATVVMYTGYVLTIFWLVKRKLFSYLTIFEHFKNEEIALHASICEAHHKAFSANKFKEDLMISEYMQCGKAASKGLLLSQRHHQDDGADVERVKSDERRPVRATQAQKNAAQRKHVRVHTDHVFSAPLVESVLSAVTFLFLVVLYVANILIQQQVYSSMNTQSLFFNYYDLSAVMKEYVLNTNLMLIYGNYIKVDGQYVEDIPDSTPGRDVASFWMKVRPTLGQYFDEADSAKIDRFLTQDLCPLTSSIPDAEERATMYELCESYIPTKTGMFTLWTSMQDLCTANRLYVRTTQKVWLNSSKETFGFSPNTNVLFNKQNIQTRYLYNSLLELFIDQLFSIMDSTLARKFASIERSLVVFTWVGACGQVLLIICAFTITFKLLRVNTEICRETYANILPETIFQNQHIHQAFKNHFVKNK